MDIIDTIGVSILFAATISFIFMVGRNLENQNDQIIAQNNQIILLLSPQNVLDTSNDFGSPMIKDPKPRKKKK